MTAYFFASGLPEMKYVYGIAKTVEENKR